MDLFLAKKYADWLLQNEDKKGTPEFENVLSSFVTAKGEYKPAEKAAVVAQEEKPEETPGLLSQAAGLPAEVVKGFVRGLTVDPLSGLSSLAYSGARAADPNLARFEETGLGKALSTAQQSLAPSDSGTLTGIGSGLGSLLSFLPGGLLKGGIKAATLAGQAAGLGSEEARARTEQAVSEGKTVTPEQQFKAQLIGVPIGLSELIPVERIAAPVKALLRGIKKSDIEKIAPDLFSTVKRITATSGEEGFQETLSNLAQDLSQKGIYDPDLEIGQSALADASMGAIVGAIAQTAIEGMTRGRNRVIYAKAKKDEEDKKFNEKLQKLKKEQEEKDAVTRERLGIKPELLALPAPQKQIEEDEAEKDVLTNPIGFIKGSELENEILEKVNTERKSSGKSKLEKFSVEDLVDAGVPQQNIDSILAAKTGYTGETNLSPEDVMNVAAEKNIDTQTGGFSDFLARTTGSTSLKDMSQPQLFSAFKSLSDMDKSESLRILPEGTNAKRFTEDQYEKSVNNIKKLFPDTGRLGAKSVIQEIKDFSGLENDKDAESLLNAAIKNGEFASVKKPIFHVVDENDNIRRSYITRDSAARAAIKEGLSVKDGLSFDIAIPDSVSDLDEVSAGLGLLKLLKEDIGLDIREVAFKEGSAPESFEVTTPDGKVVGSPQKDIDAAEAAADKFAEIRKSEAEKLAAAAEKLKTNIDKNNASIDKMRALGVASETDLNKASAAVFAKNKKLEDEIKRLLSKVEVYSQPLVVAPKGEKDIVRKGFTYFENGKPVATFDSRKQAEEALLAKSSEEDLGKIIEKAKRKGGATANRIISVAQKEIARRTGNAPAGIQVPYRGTKKAAEERLADVGVFTSDFQAKAKELSEKLRPIMDRLGLKDFRLNVERAINSPMGEADGYHVQKIIGISMSAKDPIKTIKHEAIHALKELGAFTEDQWRVLTNKAKSEWIKKYNINERYKGLTAEEQIEEAIADAFSDFATRIQPGMIGALVNKVKKIFEALKNAMNELGFQTYEDIFSAVEEGRLAPTIKDILHVMFSDLEEKEEGTLDPIKYQIKRNEVPKIEGTGRIVGSPPGKPFAIDRAEIIKKLRSHLQHPYSMYDKSRYWYENSGDEIRKISRGDKDLMERVVRLMALYSQSNSVGANVTATIKSLAELARGNSTAAAGRFPKKTAELLPDLLSAPTMDTSLKGVSDKLMNFYQNLRDAAFQEDTFSSAATMDRWMMRLIGYKQSDKKGVPGASALSETQYVYAKDLMRRIADSESKRLGEKIHPRQIQAALWTYVKNKEEQRKFNKKKKEKKKTGNYKPVSIDFSDYVKKATANVTWESRPSEKIDFISGIHKEKNKNTLRQFNEAVRSIFVDKETGEDLIIKMLGNMPLYSSQYSYGGFEGASSPNIITQIILDKNSGEYVTDIADTYAAIVGYVTKQDSVPWYRADEKAKGKFASVGYHIEANKEITPEIEEKLFKHLSKEMPGIGYTRVGKNIDFINYRDSKTGKPKLMPDKDYFEKLTSALQAFDESIEFLSSKFKAQSNYIENDWEGDPDGKSYRSWMGKAGLGDLQLKQIDNWSKIYTETARQFGKEFGWDGQPGSGNRGRRDSVRGLAPLEGAPSIRGFSGPDQKIVSVADKYARDNNIPIRRQAAYVDIDENFSKKLAAAYDAMEDNPSDPKVKEAYEDLNKQVLKQYEALRDAGYVFTFFDSETDPYNGNPIDAMLDLRNNKRLSVFSTKAGYGKELLTKEKVDRNPLLKDTGYTWKDQSGKPQEVLFNDLFRAVHDAFGHGIEGAGFRARGEENAWQAHRKLFTGPAVAALTTETRGQNSWVNYGPYGEQNRTAKVENTVFADQKIGLMPSWTWNTNIAPEEKVSETEAFTEKDSGTSSGSRDTQKKNISYSLREQIPANIQSDIDRTTTERKEEGFAEKIAEAISPTAFVKFRQAFLNKYESIERLSKKAAEMFGDAELLADTSAISAALMSDRAAGIAAEAFKSGVPVYRNGFTSISNYNGSVKGLISILEPLAEFNDPYIYRMFQYYAGAKRGGRLKAEGREKLFTDENTDQMAATLERQYPVFATVFNEYQKFNNGLVQYMKDTGVITEKDADIWTQNWDYIPFYRQINGEKTAGPNIFQSIMGVEKPKKLKGSEAPLEDFIETIVRNTRAAIESGMKNVAAQRVARDVVRTGGGELVSNYSKGLDIVSVKEAGVTKTYRFDDPLLVESLKGLNMAELPFLSILAKPSELLRNLVTKDPGFIMANLMRDSLQAWVASGTDIVPLVDTFKQFGNSLANSSPEVQALNNSGLFTGYDFSGDVKSTSQAFEKELRKRSGTRTLSEKAALPISTVWSMLEKGSEASDLATRAEIYKRTLQETGNEAEAFYRALEVMNFSRKGNSGLIRVVSALVPFFNARLQGLDILYRAGFGKKAMTGSKEHQKAFITRSLYMLALSSMYYLLASDEEEYKNAEQETRDNNWIVGGVKIPIPFELGVIFKVLPERLLAYYLGNDTGKDLKDALKRNLMSTLSFNPVPQAVLPMIENTANYSFFTGQPIVGRGLESLEPKYQQTASTSLLAKKIGEEFNYSPLMIENLIRGYTGTLGMYSVMAIDSILSGEGDPIKASLRVEQLPVFKRFIASKDAAGTVGAYYDLKEEVEKVVRTVNYLERTGEGKELKEYLSGGNARLLGMSSYIKSLDKNMTELRNMKKIIQVSSMSADKKREALTAIAKAENKITSRIQDIKKIVYK